MSSKRYVRIKKALQKKKLHAIASSMIYAAKAFKEFTVPLQARKPKAAVTKDQR